MTFPQSPELGQNAGARGGVNAWFVLAIIVVGFAFVVCMMYSQANRSADFLAVWLAGQYFPSGDIALIYPPISEVHTMQPPAGWETGMREVGYDGPIFPFLYPPIWAWLSSLVFGQMSFAAAAEVVVVANSVLIAGSVWFAVRATRGSGIGPVEHGLVAMALVLSTLIGALALFEGQPQILVTFLLLLAMERQRAGHSHVAGIALALAASIKLYPALFAVIFFARRDWRGGIAFLVTGAILALISITVAGWPMHAAFLHHVSLISSSVFVSPATVNLDGAIARLFFMDQMTDIPSLGLDGDGNPLNGWSVMRRPEWWSLLSKTIMLATVVGSILFVRHWGQMQSWALIFTLVPLISPIGWFYYYLPAALLAPALIGWLGRAKGLAFVFIGVLPAAIPMITLLRSFPQVYTYLPVYSALGMAVWALGFTLSARDKPV